MSTSTATHTVSHSERRSGTRNLIEKLLTERQRMLVLYEKVAGVEPYTAGGKPSKEVLREFSQILVDYIASGHFGLYARIVEGNERRRGVLELASKLYPRIANTTDEAVAFNDAYDASGRAELTQALTERLSKLGEELAVRIELEDELISEMLG